MREHDPPKTDKMAWHAAQEIARLGSGPLAELRRMDGNGNAPAYWRVAARCKFPASQTADWVAFVRIVAILTPRGDRENRPQLHDDKRKWGAVLCDGGDPDWQPDPNPAQRRPNLLSERRLAQLMASQGEMRRVLTIRATRMVAAKRIAGDRVNVKDIVWALLAPDKPEILARPYYRRLDATPKETEYR